MTEKINYDPDSVKYIRNLTVLDLKYLIKQCLREMKEEEFSEEQYKQLWIKPTVVTEDGFKRDG